VVVAESYARIFFRNCMSTGELYPVETDLRICEELKTGEWRWSQQTVSAQCSLTRPYESGRPYWHACIRGVMLCAHNIGTLHIGSRDKQA
jgi:hypothetical protein